MDRSHLTRLALLAGLAAACGSPLETSRAPQPGALGYGSLTGVVRGSGSGYGSPPRAGAETWPVSIAAAGPGHSALFAWTQGAEPFEFKGLVAGTWTLVFGGMHPWSVTFPSMRLYADTMITVTVLPNQTVIVPEMVPRPVAPFISIAISSCPWGFSGPPTVEDWGDCDGGYWGGVDAAVEVRGIAGTATAGVRYSLFMLSDRWHVEVRGAPAGEYEVDVVPVRSEWRLLPWQSSPVRFRVDRGLAYVQFDYWLPR